MSPDDAAHRPGLRNGRTTRHIHPIRRKIFGSILVVWTLAGAETPMRADTPESDPVSLETRLTPLIKAHRGDVAVGVKNLATGESFFYRADDAMPTASLIKFPVMIEAYRQASLKKVDLNTAVTVRKQDKVPGSGVLTTHFSVGSRFPLRDAIHLMIVFSDNTATNLVLDAIGIGATAATMEAMGYPNTKIHSKVYRRDTSVFPERSKQFGLGSTTASEMIRLFEALHRKELVGREASEEMMAHLRACDDKDKFPRFLPATTKIAFKTGSVEQSRTAAGIIGCDRGPVALCVLTNNNEDRRWVADNAGNRLCAEIAREVHAHFRTDTPRDVGGQEAGEKATAGAKSDVIRDGRGRDGVRTP